MTTPVVITLQTGLTTSLSFYAVYDGTAYSLCSQPILGDIPVSLTEPLPAIVTPLQYTKTDRSGLVTLGGTAQVAMPSNTSRHGALIQNLSSNNLWVNTTGTATSTGNSEMIPPGSEWETGADTGSVSLLGLITGQVFCAKEW
jgi:hypothetical protein